MANSINRETNWIPLMDYAMQSGVSLSTLRRHIKANKIPFKIENGRYLLSAPQNSDVAELRARLQNAQEEIAELKMLVALYEERGAPSVNA